MKIKVQKKIIPTKAIININRRPRISNKMGA